MDDEEKLEIIKNLFADIEVDVRYFGNVLVSKRQVFTYVVKEIENGIVSFCARDIRASEEQVQQLSLDNFRNFIKERLTDEA